MPNPEKNEEKDHYLHRCIGDAEMNQKFPDEQQRIAVCESYWKRKFKYGDAANVPEFLGGGIMPGEAK
jgi:hypothetical protein